VWVRSLIIHGVEVFLFINLSDSVPHYHVLARRLIIFGAPVINWIRRVLIEDVYRSICEWRITEQ
jgi:hypothetical protein